MISKTDSLPGYDAVVSSSKIDGTHQKKGLHMPQIHHKAGSSSHESSRQQSSKQEPDKSEEALKWAEPHQGDDERTAALREFAKSKLYTFDSALGAKCLNI
jgi:hypothetical protein